MIKFRAMAAIAAAAGLATGCGLSHGSAGGSYIDPAAAASSVVLHVDNQSSQSMELRTVLHGQSMFVGSVGAADSTSILLDASDFPTATLFVLGVPANAHGRALAGPLAASKGDRINFTITPEYSQSHAIVLP